MELKVWVEGIQRVICGVTEATTCQEVVVALAHAIGKTGRFTLIEKWRENERLLAPTDNPLCVLQKWGEYSSDVQFILRHSEKGRRGERSKRKENFSHNFTPHPDAVRPHGGNIKKSLTFSGAHTSYLNAAAKHRTKRIAPENSSLESLEEHSSYTSHSSKSSASPYASLEKKYRQAALPTQHVSPYNSLEKQRLSPNTNSGLQVPSPLSQSPRSNSSYSSLSPVNGDTQKRTSPSSASQPPGGIPEEYDLEHHLVGSKGDSESAHLSGGFSESEFRAKLSSGLDKATLAKLVQLQREKLTVQDSQLKVFESEIQYWTQRDEDYERQATLLKEEAERLSHSEQDINSELQELDLVSWGDKLDIEKQTEKTLQSELTLMRSKLSNAESELLQLKNKLHTLSDDLAQENGEQTKVDQEHKDSEFKVLQEVAELQKQVNQELVEHEQKQGQLDEVLNQVKDMESAILERKTQIADYERDLKECNLDGFMKAPSDMLKNPIDENPPFNRLSPARPGSGRKMTHSPQLLKETVATAKNPHGLWV